MKLLVVEDEHELRNSIVNYFREQGHICEEAATYQIAEEKLSEYDYDLVILDLNLPDGDGMKLISDLKLMQPDTGILILSARDSLDDKIDGLDLGADDYLTKPFHLSELNSRVNALIRRRQFKGTNKIVFHEIELDPAALEAKVNGVKLDVTKKEFDLILYFITNKNRVLTKEAIAEHLWGDHIDMVDNYDFIYTHIKNLRQKIEQAGGTDYLQTIYGMGYKFTD